jgi:hypothetical protein
MTVFTEANLFHGLVTNGTDTLYTVPALTTAIVKDIFINNTTATAATITIWLDPNGTTAGDAEAILKTFNVPASDFVHISGFFLMAAAATIKATAGTTNVISVQINGATLT